MDEAGEVLPAEPEPAAPSTHAASIADTIVARGAKECPTVT